MTMIEWIIIFVQFAIIGFLVFRIFGFINTQEILEEWVVNTHLILTTTFDTMRDIDSQGAFEADDEVGMIFDGIKDAIKVLEEYSTDTMNDQPNSTN